MALTAFKACLPDRSVEGDGLLAFWWKGETTCASVKELKRLKEQGKRFELNGGLSIELNAFAESVDLSGSSCTGKGLVPPGPDGHGIGPTVEIVRSMRRTAAKRPSRTSCGSPNTPTCPAGSSRPAFRPSCITRRSRAGSRFWSDPRKSSPIVFGRKPWVALLRPGTWRLVARSTRFRWVVAKM